MTIQEKVQNIMELADRCNFVRVAEIVKESANSEYSWYFEIIGFISNDWASQLDRRVGIMKISNIFLGLLKEGKARA